jgi:D-glycero-D-manno-heptose 1,7-bisphosphate phosphatase
LIDGVGLWAERHTRRDLAGRPALFLDRDGVIVEETHYLSRIEDIVMIPHMAEAIALANASAIPVIVVTNQAGIARGYYGWEDFAEVQAAIGTSLGAAGAKLDVVLACGYHDVGSGPLAIADHPWRKPNCGMLDYAAKQHGIDLSRSWIIGDKVSDLSAGLKAGVAGGFLVKTGHGEVESQGMPLAQAPFVGKTFECGIRDDAGVAIRELMSNHRLG